MARRHPNRSTLTVTGTPQARSEPVRLPIGFHDLTLYHELSITSWRRLLKAVGSLGGPTGLATANLNHEAIWSFLTSHPDSASPELLDALDALEALGNDAGLEAIFEAAADIGADLKEWPEIEAVMELVLRLWLDAREDDALAQVLLRARLQAQGIRRRRRFHEFAGKEARNVAELDKATITERVREWCLDKKRGEYVHVMLYKVAAEQRIEILHGHILKTELAITDRPTPLKYRPAHADHVRYDGATGRLSIASRSSTLLPFYRELIGELVADDRDFFLSENVCSLRPLQQEGEAALGPDRHSVAGIRRVAVTDLVWLLGEERIRISGGDSFRGLRRLQVARPSEGELLEAKLEIDVIGRTRKVTVHVRVPKTIDIRGAGSEEPIIEQFLTEVGIRGVFPDNNAEGTDLWHLFPWRHPERVWRQVLGAPQFDALKERSYFTTVALSTVAHPEHTDVHGALSVHPIDPNTSYGVSMVESVPSRTLTPTDTTAYELRTDAVIAEVAARLGLLGSSQDLGQALWFVGRRNLAPSVDVAVFLAMRQPPEDLLGRTQTLARSSRTVLLVPRGRRSGVFGVDEVECILPGGPFDRVLIEIVDALGLRAEVAPELIASPDTRLILDSRRCVARLDGVLLTKVAAGTKPYQLLEALARANGGHVSNERLLQILSPGQRNSDPQEPKRVKGRLMQAIKQSFTDSNLEVPAGLTKIIKGGGGGYRLQVPTLVL